MNFSTKEQSTKKLEELLSKPYILILHNDDFNSFDWVIKCLIEVCNHELEQANQCACITHQNGKCEIKLGDFETISEMKKKLSISGLSVTINKNKY
jgi:ATP-dependent Clp protease adaptor protein ClpS